MRALLNGKDVKYSQDIRGGDLLARLPKVSVEPAAA